MRLSHRVRKVRPMDTSTRFGFNSLRHASSLRRDDFVLQGFTLTVRSEHTLTIDCPPGCQLKVLSGRAWITVDGVLSDVIADAGDSVQLRVGAVTHVSALFQVVTFMVTAPTRFHEAGFALQTRGGKRVLAVTTGRGRFHALLDDLRACIPALTTTTATAIG